MKARKRTKYTPRKSTWKCYGCCRFLHIDNVHDKTNYVEKTTYKSRGGNEKRPGKLPTTHRYTLCVHCRDKIINDQVEAEELEIAQEV